MSVDNEETFACEACSAELPREEVWYHDVIGAWFCAADSSGDCKDAR